jgi:hypothetical protein
MQVLTILFMENPHLSELEKFLTMLAKELELSRDFCYQDSLVCLMKILEIRETRKMFQKAGGISKLEKLIVEHLNQIQILFHIIFCIWELSFSKENLFYGVNTLVASLHQVLKKVQKEKVIRVTLETFSNLVKNEG